MGRKREDGRMRITEGCRRKDMMEEPFTGVNVYSVCSVPVSQNIELVRMI